MLEDVRVVRAVAALLLLVGLVVGGLVFGKLGLAHGFYRLVDFYPDRPYEWGERMQWVASNWGWRLDYAVAGLLGLAAVGLTQSVRQAYAMNRQVSNGWIIGVVTAFASSGVRIIRVFAAAGIIHSTTVALRAVESVAKELLTHWGSFILEVQRD